MKNTRHSKIIEIIQNEIIETQEDLVRRLNQEGFQVTQATISRDIKQLNLVKVQVTKGDTTKQKYALHVVDSRLNEKYVRVLKDGFVSMDMAQNILVIKTVSGMAMAVAAALDALKIPQVVGCIAGDDTIMCAIRSTNETYEVMDELRRMVE